MKIKQLRLSAIRWLVLVIQPLAWWGCTAIQPLVVKGPAPAPVEIFSHARFDAVLKRIVDEQGLVDYAALRSDPSDLEAYYRLIATFSPDSHPAMFPGRSHRLAYWINAYNATVLKTVLQYYPIDSVIDVRPPALLFFMPAKSGFFLFQRLTYGGKQTSLYFLENGVMRKRFDDPRIHFVLNCASMGCPRLPKEAFDGDRLEQQLARESLRFISEDRNFRIDRERRRIFLSSIFDWYRIDFTRTEIDRSDASLRAYIAGILPPEQAALLQSLPSDYILSFVPYDWDLNRSRIRD